MMLSLWLFCVILLVMQCSSFSSSEDPKIDHLQALGLAPPFYQFWDYEIPNENVIKAAYKSQSLLYHPDKNDQPDAMDRFIAIRNAYDELKGSGPDAERRRKLAAARYQHHGQMLRAAKHHIRQLPAYCQYVYKHYLLVIWWYAVALWKEFCNNPKDSYLRFLYNWNHLSTKDIVFTLFVSWLIWKAVCFISFLFTRKVKSVFSLSEEVIL